MPCKSRRRSRKSEATVLPSSVMEEAPNHGRSDGKISWRGTLLTQAALCLALYGALSIGRTADSMSGTSRRMESLDLYFLSVRGGFWPADEQARLLQQMAKAAEFYKAKFVINIGELGKDDPLMQKATLYFPMRKIPWYTTTAGNTTTTLSGQSKNYFFKKIKIVYDQMLDIIVIETGLFQDFPLLEQLEESASDQLYWMQQKLSVSDSKWRIVVGFHPLIVCQLRHEQKSPVLYHPLHQTFLNYGVNVYLSKMACVGQHFSSGGIAYLGNPGPLNQVQIPLSNNGSLDDVREGTGFLLHRVTSFEIESYYINLDGMIVSSSQILQHGKEIM